ncbi:glutamyl aminopeptidase-like [Watersipora subatra]|uniref:glutamyl aminopeptidase-like n=1 Tax=Watersipora subatra TaxID=2589382 RepID=UPI00355BAAAA
MSVTLSKGKLIAIFLAGALVCVGVGLGCWYGKPSGGTSNQSKQTEQTTSLVPSDEDDFPPGTAPWLNLHLPSYTVPKHYDLTLYPNFYESNERFEGNVTIEIEVRQAAWHLLVHIKRLDTEVTSVVSKETGESYGVSKQWGYEPNQFWIVKTKKMIEESTTVLLTIKFSGSLTDGIVGLYKAFYANNTMAMATSKFEPVDARKAFPCFDEPNLKAPFTTTLIHQQGYTALSNMPVQSTRIRSDQLQETKFEKSVPMSTYLACFIVCKCKSQQMLLKSNKTFSVYAVEGMEDQVEYALEIGVNVTDYFEDYFGLDYPLPKMDMIAIPDFVSGAMEHWGLITFRETNLLYKEGVSSPANKQRIAEVVAHELAHQWFGNIVTMDWWDDLWLNEGFATFMAYVGVEPFEPEMEMFNQFAPIEIFTVMPQDSLASSHPIIVPVKRPEDITAVFDAISYNKGASVIRMLEAIVGTDAFKGGLSSYLQRYQYDNAKTYQLWESIGEKVPEQDIAHLMDTWTKQRGFPLVTLAYDEQQNTINATQTLYRDKNDESDWPHSDFNYLWQVPLHYTSSAGPSNNDFPWLYSNSSTVTFPSPVSLSQNGAWLKFNKNTTGYYRVNYPDDWWNNLGSLLTNDTDALDAGDKAGLINDAISLPKFGHLSYSTALNFINYMANESHYVAWISVYSEVFNIRNLLGGDKWKKFVRNLVSKAYEDLAWEIEGSHLEQLLKGSLIRLMCGHGSPECLAEAKNRFTPWLDNPSSNQLDATFRRDILIYGMRNVTEAEWEKVWDLYNTEPVASAKSDMRRGLAQTDNVNLIKRYLEYAMDKEKIPDQDFFSVISYLGSNSVGLPIVWDFVRDNYDAIKTRFGVEHRYFGRMIPDLVEGFTTPERLQEVEDFYNKEKEEGSGKRARELSLQQIKMAIDWKDRFADEVNAWLDQNV